VCYFRLNCLFQAPKNYRNLRPLLFPKSIFPQWSHLASNFPWPRCPTQPPCWEKKDCLLFNSDVEISLWIRLDVPLHNLPDATGIPNHLCPRPASRNVPPPVFPANIPLNCSATEREAPPPLHPLRNAFTAPAHISRPCAAWAGWPPWLSLACCPAIFTPSARSVHRWTLPTSTAIIAGAPFDKRVSGMTDESVSEPLQSIGSRDTGAGVFWR